MRASTGCVVKTCAPRATLTPAKGGTEGRVHAARGVYRPIAALTGDRRAVEKGLPRQHDERAKGSAPHYFTAAFLLAPPGKIIEEVL